MQRYRYESPAPRDNDGFLDRGARKAVEGGGTMLGYFLLFLLFAIALSGLLNLIGVY